MVCCFGEHQGNDNKTDGNVACNGREEGVEESVLWEREQRAVALQ